MSFLSSQIVINCTINSCDFYLFYFKLDNYIDKYLWDFMIVQVNRIKKTIKAGIFLIFY